MSLSGSIGTSEAKLPGQARDAGQGPEPTAENPGGVFPASDPNPAPAGSVPGTGGASQPVSDVGNPFQLADILKDLDAALGRAVSAIAGEQHSGEPDPIVTKLTGWRDEVAGMLQHGGAGPNARNGASADGPTAQEGGLYAD